MLAENRRRCLLYVAHKMQANGFVQERRGTPGHEIADSQSIEKIANALTHAAKLVTD